MAGGLRLRVLRRNHSLAGHEAPEVALQPLHHPPQLVAVLLRLHDRNREAVVERRRQPLVAGKFCFLILLLKKFMIYFVAGKFCFLFLVFQFCFLIFCLSILFFIWIRILNKKI